MGTYIGLSLQPSKITQQEWEMVYEESLILLRAYPFADIQEKRYFGTTIPVYVKSEEKTETSQHWSTCGDLSSKRYAESFKLYRNIINYKKGLKEWNGLDIILEDDSDFIVEIFDSKTQGLDYHLYILAIAMLIESRFPMYALVGGNIDYKQCVRAKEWADKHLSAPIDIPARVDYAAILFRSSHNEDDHDKIKALEKWLITDHEKFFEIIYDNFSEKTFQSWFLAELKGYSSPCQLGSIKLLICYLNKVKDIPTLINLSCIHDAGPKYSPEEMIKAVARTWVSIPREKFTFLGVFDKVEGHPTIVERQFGTVMMDLMFSGREIETYISQNEVLSSFSFFYPELVELPEVIFEKEKSEIESKLEKFQTRFKTILELTNQNSTNNNVFLSDDDAFLFYDGKNVTLTEDQDFNLKTIAYSINTLLSPVNNENNTLNQILSKSNHEKKRALAMLTAESFHMTLTEETWIRIDEIDKEDKINVLLAKLVIDDLSDSKYSKNAADIRKALFENDQLLDRLCGYVNDEQEMERIKKWVSNNPQ